MTEPLRTMDFLDDPYGKSLLDRQLDGYTLVTYRLSQLPDNVLKAIDIVAVKELKLTDIGSTIES